jgi:hypothetical protein
MSVVEKVECEYSLLAPEITFMINALNKDLVVVSGMMNSQVPVLNVVNRCHLKL